MHQSASMKLGFLRLKSNCGAEICRNGQHKVGWAGLDWTREDSKGASWMHESWLSGVVESESPACNMNPSLDKRTGGGYREREKETDQWMGGLTKAPSLLLVSGVTSQWDQCHLPASGRDSFIHKAWTAASTQNDAMIQAEQATRPNK